MLATVATGAGAGAAIDLWTRRVPNPLTVALAALGVAFAACGIGSLSVGASLAGFLLGLVLMLPGHLFGATGAGDVKFFAAMGALIGPAHIATAFFYTAIAGGALALAVSVRRRRLAQTLTGTARLFGADAAGPLDSAHGNNRFAYAPAIAVGTMVAALGW